MILTLITHFIIDSNISNEYITFINKEFDSSEHNFITLNNHKLNYLAPQVNLVKISSKAEYIKLIFLLHRSKKILIHGLFDSKVIMILFMMPWLLKKCSWVIWGGDLYGDILNPVSTRSKKYQLFFKLKKFVVSRFSNIVYLSPGDELIFERVYETKLNYIFGMYVNPVTVEHLDSVKNIVDTIKNEDTIKIILGNSATESNCHLEALESLAKFKDNNIKIIAPLSYGDKSYAELVIRYGQSVFGDKFIPILNLMSPNEYSRLLSSVDIGVFYNNRQQALGNIYALLYLGKKIFIRSDISSWKYLTEFFNFGINDSLNINSMEYGQFIKVDEEVSKDNNKMSEKYFYNTEYLIDVWNKIFLDK